MMQRKGGEGAATDHHPPFAPETLSFHVDLWNEARTAVERVLARAASPTLAQAVFVAARRDFPGRYLTLNDGLRTISTSD